MIYVVISRNAGCPVDLQTGRKALAPIRTVREVVSERRCGGAESTPSSKHRWGDRSLTTFSPSPFFFNTLLIKRVPESCQLISL